MSLRVVIFYIVVFILATAMVVYGVFFSKTYPLPIPGLTTQTAVSPTPTPRVTKPSVGFGAAQTPTAKQAPDYLQKTTTSTGNTIKKNSYIDGNVMYLIRGTITEQPKFDNTTIHGMVIFEGDPTKQSIPFTIRGSGLTSLVSFEGSFDGASTVEQMGAVPLTEHLPVGTNVQLQVFSPNLTNTEKEVFPTIEAMMQNNWTLPAGFILPVTLVGVIKK